MVPLDNSKSGVIGRHEVERKLTVTTGLRSLQNCMIRKPLPLKTSGPKSKGAYPTKPLNDYRIGI